MRRRLAYVLVWTVATAVTVSGSWLGIRSMLAAGGAQRSAPLSAADLRQVAVQPTPTPSPTPRPKPRPTPTPTPTPKPTQTKKPAPTRSARNLPAPRPTPSWQKVSDGRPGQAYRRLFQVRGGEVEVQINQEQVRVLKLEPARGFEPDVRQDGPTTLRVSFESDSHNSRVQIIWRGDAPYAEVTESV